jgi:hypothetical protein
VFYDDYRLKASARDFASRKGVLDMIDAEFAFTPDYSGCDKERTDLESKLLEPACRQVADIIVNDRDLEAKTALGSFSMSPRAALRERHIGVDQGRRNFAIVAVDRELNNRPVVVAAAKYNLGLQDGFTASDVVVQLREKTDLWQWMQQTDQRTLPEVGRVIVYVEQMSPLNPDAKKFGIELGRLLQQSVVDPDTCIVVLSQPYLFRSGGVIDCIGSHIVQQLNLLTCNQSKKCSRPTTTEGACSTSVNPTNDDADDVEPSDDNSSDSETDDGVVNDDSHGLSYRDRKRMSANIFNYFVCADDAKQEDLQVSVCPILQNEWQTTIARERHTKLDDLGDALLHALGGLLCGGSRYRQLMPANVSAHNNRTVVVAVCPDLTFYAVIHCTWNSFEIEDIGFMDTGLTSKIYGSEETVDDIKQLLMSHLAIAMTDPSGSDLYRRVDVIKIVVKQLKGFLNFTREHAGALTKSTVRAVRHICDEAAGPNSDLCERNDKTLGSIYIRTQAASGQKFQVVCSAGKLTNAILSCLDWMHENAADFMKYRTASMNEKTKLSFYNNLQSIAESAEVRMEQIVLSERTRSQLTSPDFRSADDSTKAMMAYLILVGINKNEQYVKAVAVNYRKVAAPQNKLPKIAATEGQTQ